MSVSDELFPSKPCVEWRPEQFEDGELVTEKIIDVTPVQAVDDGEGAVPAGHTYFTPQGKLVTKSKAAKVHPPANPEEFRSRFNTLKACWECARMRNSGKSWVADLDKDTWSNHVEYVLGKNVYRCKAGDQGEIRPTWTTLLNYGETRSDETRK